MFLYALAVLLRLLSLYVGASSASCGCSSVIIPVHVDVFVPKDPTDIFGGLKSNASALRRVDDPYNIYGVFCEPMIEAPKSSDVLQLLVHGFTYTSQYWSLPVEEFRNYSYATFSCDHGSSSFAIDWVGVGLSSRPTNASDVQYPTAAAAVSQVARHLKTTSILPGVAPFNKIIGIGHSAGSGLLNFGAIVDGTQSPFDGLILTASLIFDPSAVPPISIVPPARVVDPVRWGTLDPGYVSTDNRTAFYPANPASFSPRMMILDKFTKDVGTVGTFLQTPTTGLPVPHYAGPVAKIVGSEDQIFCAGTGRCDDVAALTALERVLWQAAESFELAVLQGSGHDLNLDFFAEAAFRTYFAFATKFSGKI
ncbi:hypothetical protein FB451DRAFT_1092964 [Mycena latifolia]|nr:hypothetical protein FB451DRAFT_1092964 [Mycena latifolia]